MSLDEPNSEDSLQSTAPPVEEPVADEQQAPETDVTHADEPQEDAPDADREEEEQGGAEEDAPQAPPPPPPPPANARWYIVRAQSEREERIKEALEERIRAAGQEHLFGRVLVPSEHISEIRGGKKRITMQKMYPRYILIEMELTDDSWLLVNETPGISGFVSADRRRPQPMPKDEITRILNVMEARKEKPKPKMEFEVGETVRIKEGPFQNYDGKVEEVQAAKGLVKIAVSIFGRSTNVEVEFSKVEKM